MRFRNPLKERALAVRNRARTLLSGPRLGRYARGGRSVYFTHCILVCARDVLRDELHNWQRRRDGIMTRLDVGQG